MTILPRRILIVCLICSATHTVSCFANTLSVEVNTITGLVQMQNSTGADVTGFDLYTISSVAESLNVAGWMSIEQQDIPGFPPGNGTGNGWEELGGTSDENLTEAYLLGSSTFTDGMVIWFGLAYDTEIGAQDLEFTYRAGGQVTNGTVSYVVPEPTTQALGGLLVVLAIMIRKMSK